MKQSFLMTLFALLIGSQWQLTTAQQVEWVQQIGGSGDERVWDICTDANGNVYVTGETGGAIIGADTFLVNGTRDAFLAKFSAAGEYQWATTFGGEVLPPTPNEDERGRLVRYNAISDEIIQIGTYEDNGSGAHGCTGQEVNGYGMFVAAHHPDGTCSWFQDLPGLLATGAAIDDLGHVYAVGLQSWSQQYFMAKYNSTGDQLWYKFLAEDAAGHWIPEADGELTIAGSYLQGATLVGATVTPTPSAVANTLFAQIDTSAEQLLGTSVLVSDSAAGFTCVNGSPDGTYVASGGFLENLILQTDTLIAGSEQWQPVLARLDSAGTPIWILHFETSEVIYSAVPSTVADGSSIYVALDVASPTTFGSVTVTSTTARDLVVARFDMDGNCLAVVQAGGLWPGRLQLHGTADGGVLVGGSFSMSMDLDSGLTSTGGIDAFVAKYGQITSVPEQRSGADQSLHIYANPNDGTCTIDLPEGLEWTQALVLNIYDLNGRLVQSEPVGRHSGPLKLDIRAQARGSYPVELTDGAQRYSG
ncbi:MAG: SBBP repeat-containing protein, partial [Flavobacteriales bacterium]|nr:SBBP repeat-containing protein [Flavobacteriales bacterium]